MLDAHASLLCSKLCRHNVDNPSRGRLGNVPSFIMHVQSFCFTTFSLPLSSWFAKGPYSSHVGDAVAQWLAHWTPDREVQVRALARSLCCVLGKNTLLVESGKAARQQATQHALM